MESIYRKFIEQFLQKVSKLETDKEIDEANLHHIQYINELTKKYLNDVRLIRQVQDIVDEIIDLSLDDIANKEINDDIVNEINDLNLSAPPSPPPPSEEEEKKVSPDDNSLDSLLSNLVIKTKHDVIKKWKPKSIDLCKINMESLAKGVFNDDVFDINKFINEPQKVFDYLDGTTKCIEEPQNLNIKVQKIQQQHIFVI